MAGPYLPGYASLLAGSSEGAQGLNDYGDGKPAHRSLTLEVSLMTEPCLWRWEIREAPTRLVLRSSWDDEWAAYPTQDEAKRYGLEALDHLIKES